MSRPRLSASQIATFRDCARKWAWGKIEKVPQAPNRYAELGSRVHEVLENWLRDGTPFPDTKEGRIAASGIAHLPMPGVAEVEGDFQLSLASADFTGRIDAQFLENGVPVILDHKTTSGLQWAKTAEDLRVDVQAMIYAAHALEKYDTTAVQLRWVYYLTDETKAKSKRVHLLVHAPEIAEQLEYIDETAAEIAEIYKQGARALDLTPHVPTCTKYGGCPYVTNCNLSSSERMRGYMTTMTWAERVKARKAEQSGALAAPQEAPPVAAASARLFAPAREAYVNPPEQPITQLAEPAPQVETPKPLGALAAKRAAKKTAAKPLEAAYPKGEENLTTEDFSEALARADGREIMDNMNKSLARADAARSAPTQALIAAIEGAPSDVLQVVNNGDKPITITLPDPARLNGPALTWIDTAAIQIFAASIAAREHFDDELQRAKTAYSRARALFAAR